MLCFYSQSSRSQILKYTSAHAFYNSKDWCVVNLTLEFGKGVSFDKTPLADGVSEGEGEGEGDGLRLLLLRSSFSSTILLNSVGIIIFGASFCNDARFVFEFEFSFFDFELVFLSGVFKNEFDSFDSRRLPIFDLRHDFFR